MTGLGESGERRIVLHPRTAAARRHGRARSRGGFVRGHAVDHDTLGELISRQRHQAVRSALMLVVPLLLLPAAFVAVPSIVGLRPFGVPSLAWLVLSPGVFPLFVVLGRWHERRAERIETDWVEANR